MGVLMLSYHTHAIMFLKMIWSRFNFLFKDGDNCYLYNSLSNSLAQLDASVYNVLSENEDDSLFQSDKDDELFQRLCLMKAYVDSDEDEMLKLKYFAHFRRFANEELSLTINPTLDCNFACPYCFEKNHPRSYMSDEIEREVISFIKRHKKIRKLTVIWFGGEPLLAFNRIVSLTNLIKELGIKYEAGMITNGYLLTDKVVSHLDSLLVKSIQVTIDGLAPIHDSRRCLKNGIPTFEKILYNIKKVRSTCPTIKINVRVNIDRTNCRDFVELYKIFQTKEYEGIALTPAFVDDVNNLNACVLNSSEQYDYIKDLFKQEGISFSSFYPQPQKECFVRNNNFVVIGPDGEMYKCWNDIGDPDKVYGYINGEITNEKLLLHYLAASDPFEDEQCKKCLLLPVCGGGCPYQRLRRDYEKSDIMICPLIKDNLKDYLINHIHAKTL